MSPAYFSRSLASNGAACSHVLTYPLLYKFSSEPCWMLVLTDHLVGPVMVSGDHKPCWEWQYFITSARHLISPWAVGNRNPSLPTPPSAAISVIPRRPTSSSSIHCISFSFYFLSPNSPRVCVPISEHGDPDEQEAKGKLLKSSSFFILEDLLGSW